MNYNRKDLANLYGQVRGKEVPPRKHLQVYNEASYEEVTAMMAKLNKDGLLQPDNELEYIKRYLTKRPLEGGVKEYLLSKNITNETLEDKSAPDAIVDILNDNGDLQNYLNYVNSKPVSFTREVRSGKSGKYAYVGNLIDKMKRVTGLKEETLNELLVLKGTEGSRGVGMGELAMSTIFSDVSMRDGAGDLTWNNQYLEVKGSGARLGGDFSGKPYQGFEHTALGKLTGSLNMKIPDGTDVAKLINTLAGIEEIDQKDLMEALMEFTERHYPDNNIDITSGLNLTEYKPVRQALQLAYASDYASKHNVEWYIMINTILGKPAFGQYYLFKPSSLQDYIKTDAPFNLGAIKLNDLGPALLTIGSAKFN